MPMSPGKTPNIWPWIPIPDILLGLRLHVKDVATWLPLSHKSNCPIGQPLLVTEHPVSHGLLDRFETCGIVPS